MKIAFVHPIFAPTQGQAERNIRSVRSLAAYIRRYPLDDIGFYFAGWGLDPFIGQVIAAISDAMKEYEPYIHIFDRNFGKAYVTNFIVNEIVKKRSRPKILFLADSDIVFDVDCPRIFERIFEIMGRSIEITGKPFGLVALSQKEGNCHLSIARKNRYEFVNSFGDTENFFFPDAPAGIAGGCWACSLDAWETVHGYRQMGVYAGDDAFFLLDVASAGFSFQLADDLYIIHPVDHDPDYAIWKRDVCMRDSDGITKPDTSAQIEEAERFWLERSSNSNRSPVGRGGEQQLSSHGASEILEPPPPRLSEGPLALLTYHGTLLFMDPASDEIGHLPPEQIDEAWPLVCAFLGPSSRLGKVNADGSTSELGNRDTLLPEPAPESTLSLERLPDEDQIAIRADDCYVSAEPNGRVRRDIRHLREWERFTPVKLAAAHDMVVRSKRRHT